LPADVARRDLAFPGQRGEYLGVRSQQHRAERHVQLASQPAQRRDEIVRDLRFMLSCACCGIKAPPGDRGEPADDEHTTPKLMAGLCLKFH
jgi:hypothetical protein